MLTVNLFDNKKKEIIKINKLVPDGPNSKTIFCKVEFRKETFIKDF